MAEAWTTTCTFYNWRVPQVTLIDGNWYILSVQREEGVRVIPRLFIWKAGMQAFIEVDRPSSVVPLAAVALFAAVPEYLNRFSDEPFDLE
jgi:hypothetical protein